MRCAIANELQYTITGEYQKGNNRKITFGGTKNKKSISGNTRAGTQVSVATSEEVIPLGEVTAAGAYMWVKNLDDTNYIELRTATGASNDAIRCPAGKEICFYWGSDVSAPYWIANTAACLVEYELIPD